MKKLTIRQKEILSELKWCDMVRNVIQGPEPLSGRNFSKRHVRLVKEYWSIERSNRAATVRAV